MRQGELIFNWVVFLGPLVIGLGLLFLLPVVYSWPLGSTITLGLSFIFCASFLIYAKSPNLRASKLITFGLSSVEPIRKKYYVLAYVCLFIGFMLSMAIVVVSNEI